MSAIIHGPNRILFEHNSTLCDGSLIGRQVESQWSALSVAYGVNPTEIIKFIK